VRVTLTALGGLGEFGANSMLLDAGDDGRLLLDAGAAFSDQASLGVAFEVPDFAALGRRRPRAVVLSHPHDDHVKGLPWLEEAFPGVETLASRVTHAWRPAPLGRKLAGAAHTLDGRGRTTVGPWEIEALPVSHSVPGTVALRLCGPSGTLVLLSDLRLAASALGEETDADALARWGDAGVDLALVDSTNALVAKEPPPEGTVAGALGELIRGASGLVVAVSFASHLGRFRQVAMAAAAAGRAVVPCGRGLLESLAVQGRLGGLGLPLGLVRPTRELSKLPRDRVVAVVTGSQGERGSAFHRLAHGLLPGLELRPGDTVLHAARVIPGNERELATIFDHCVRRGARVITAAEAPIHVSGHPHQGELATLLELVRPRVVLPVHGRRRNLEAVASLAASKGSRTVVAENLQELLWEGDSLGATGQSLEVGRVQLDDLDGARLDPAIVRQRRAASSGGVVVVVVPWSAASGGVLGRPVILHWGVADGPALVDRLEHALGAELRSREALGSSEPETLRSTIAAWLRKELRRAGPRRPLLDVVIQEL
jgi:ribonuclease J